MGYRLKKQTAPATPPTGQVIQYLDIADSVFKYKDENGNIRTVSGVDGIDTLTNLNALPRSEGKIYYATDADAIYTDDGVSLSTASGAATSLGGMSDVNLTSLKNNDILQYNFGSSEWQNAPDVFIPAGTGFYANGTEVKRFDITVTSDTTDFGTLPTNHNNWFTGLASTLRTVWAGGASTGTDVIEYIDVATGGLGLDFGDLSTAAVETGSCASNTRGLISLGSITGGTVWTVTTEYITFATISNSIFFGNLTVARSTAVGVASQTRGVFMGGEDGGITWHNEIDYFTIASTGNATTFGALTQVKSYGAACSNNIRGIHAGGLTTPTSTYTNVMDYITIATTSAATDFGDLITARNALAGASNPTRAVFGGGYDGGAEVSTTEWVEIASTGNGNLFGNLTTTLKSPNQGCSNSHGGL